MATKWGIVSAAKIAHDFCTALQFFPQDDHKVVAIAARSHDRAKDFAEKFEVPKVYGCYEDLAKDKDIDIAYVASVNTEHYKLTKMMLHHGKHVLCEKPMTTDLKLTKELIELAREKKLFLMEGYWTRFFPVFDKIRTELPSIGEVKMVCAQIAKDISSVERIYSPALGGGGMFDLGCYAVQLATMIYGCRPEKIVCDGTLLPSGVDEGGCIILRYSGGRFAQLSYHTSCGYLNRAEIIGSKGAFEISKPFWHPTKVKTPIGEYEFCLKEGKFPFIFPNSAGLEYEAECVRKCLQKGKTECDLMPHEHSIIIAEVMEEVRRQLGAE